MPTERYTHLIWDFNGTILDDLDACFASANALLQAHGLRPLTSLAQYRSLFGFPVIEYYRRLGFDFEQTPYESLAVEWVAYYLERAGACRLYPGIRETLASIHALQVSQTLLSATEEQMLQGQLRELGLEDAFDEVLGQRDIHAHGKVGIAGRWREQNPDARVLLVGDTEHDAEVARAIGADCILLTCGHQPPETLLACQPLAVLDSAEDVLPYLQA